MSVTTTNRMSAREFMQLEEDPREVRRELVDGEIVVSPSPTPRHSAVDRILTAILVGHVRARRLGRIFGDVDNVVSESTVRRPDIFYFSTGRLHLATADAIEGPPDLCVEIISPASQRTDRSTKLMEYAAFGVANYWTIDPKLRTADAFVLKVGRYTLAGSGSKDEIVHFPPFPDLDIPLSELWWPA